MEFHSRETFTFSTELSQDKESMCTLLGKILKALKPGCSFSKSRRTSREHYVCCSPDKEVSQTDKANLNLCFHRIKAIWNEKNVSQFVSNICFLHFGILRDFFFS